jgi:predicted DNA-binding transcriptional regulator AlpA
MTLPVTVHFHEGETPLSLTSRLAAANGYSSLANFLDYTDINAKMIESGESNAIASLSHWSGIAVDSLQRFAISSGETRATWKIGSAEFSKDMRRGNRHRFCAHCVLEDLEQEGGRAVARPWVRSWWMVRAILSCERHNIALIEVDVEDIGDRNDFVQFVADNVDRFRDLATKPKIALSTRVDTYLRDRVMGIAGPSFVDGLAAYVVVELSSYAGWFIEKHNVEGPWATADDCRDTREKGFMALNAGRDEFEEMYVRVIRREHPTRGDIKLFLGRILSWLRRNADKPSHSDVVDLFQNIVVRHIPIGPGDVFIREVQVRHLHSITSASAEFALLPKRVRDLIIAAGLAEASGLADPQFRFDAELARPILEAASATLTSREVAEILGTTADHVRGIMDAGLLPRVENNTSTRVYSRVRKGDLDEFQARLLAQANASDLTGQLKSVGDVCRHCMCSLDVLVRLILEGKFRTVSILGNDGILSDLHLDPYEVAKFLQSQKEMELTQDPENVLTIKEAERLLGTATITVHALVEQGLLKFVTRRNLRTGGQYQGFERSEVEAFKETYVSLSALAKAWRTSRVMAKVRLDELGIFPIFEPEGFVARIYEKTKIKASGFPV